MLGIKTRRPRTDTEKDQIEALFNHQDTVREHEGHKESVSYHAEELAAAKQDERVAAQQRREAKDGLLAVVEPA